MVLIHVPFIKGIGCLYLDLFGPVTESGEACSILHFNTLIHGDLISQELERTRGRLFQSHAQPWDDFLGPVQTPSLLLIRSGRQLLYSRMSTDTEIEGPSSAKVSENLPDFNLFVFTHPIFTHYIDNQL